MRLRAWFVTTRPCCVHSWTHAGADSSMRNLASELHAPEPTGSGPPPLEGRPMAITPAKNALQSQPHSNVLSACGTEAPHLNMINDRPVLDRVSGLVLVPAEDGACPDAMPSVRSGTDRSFAAAMCPDAAAGARDAAMTYRRQMIGAGLTLGFASRAAQAGCLAICRGAPSPY